MTNKNSEIPDFMNIDDFMLDETYFDGILTKKAKQIVGDFKNSGLGNDEDFEDLEHFGKNRAKSLLKGL